MAEQHKAVTDSTLLTDTVILFTLLGFELPILESASRDITFCTSLNWLFHQKCVTQLDPIFSLYKLLKFMGPNRCELLRSLQLVKGNTKYLKNAGFVIYRLQHLYKNHNLKQTGADLGRAQTKICLLGKLMLSSSIVVIFHCGCPPLMSSSIDVVLHIGCLPLRSFFIYFPLSLCSIEFFFH